MNKLSIIESNKTLKNLPGVLSDIVQGQTLLRRGYDIKQGLLEHLENNAQVSFEYKVFLHLNEMLLLKVQPVGVIHQLMQYLDFYEALNRIFLFILYNFHSVHGISGQVYTFNYLSKGALSQILDNLILMIIR